MKPAMTRRKFLTIAIALVVTFIGGMFIFVPFEKVITGILKNQLSYLKLNPGALDSFARDIKKTNYYTNKNFGWGKQLFVRIYRFIENPWITWPGKSKYDQYVTFFVNDFLLSTDFFYNKMNELETVNYTALYEPYKRPCSNPFSNLFYSSAA